MTHSKEYYEYLLAEISEVSEGKCRVLTQYEWDFSECDSEDFHERFWMVISSSFWHFSEDDTSTFLEDHSNDLDWYWVSRTQKLTLQDVRNHIDKVLFGQISVHQTLDREFIEEFQDRLDWEYLAANQKAVDKELLEANLHRYIKPASVLSAGQLDLEDRLRIFDEIREQYKDKVEKVLSEELTEDSIIDLECDLGKIKRSDTKNTVYNMVNLFQFYKYSDENLDDILNIFEESNKISIDAVANLGVFQDPGEDLVGEYADLFKTSSIQENPFMDDAKKQRLVSRLRMEELGFGGLLG